MCHLTKSIWRDGNLHRNVGRKTFGMTLSKKKVLLFSTLNPYPFWAGSETYWFEFLRDPNVRDSYDFHVVLADSPKTRAKGQELEQLGITSSFYKHFNVDFLGRNIYRLRDKLRSASHKTLPWYDAI